MAKGMVEVIFWIAMIFIILMVAGRFFSSFAEATPGLQSQKDLQGTIELVCSVDGPSASSLVVFLPKTDSLAGNPQFQKVHLTVDGALQLYQCAGTGTACSGSPQKTLVPNCPSGTKFTDCWVAPTNESISVTVKKDSSRKISFNQTEGVFCK